MKIAFGLLMIVAGIIIYRIGYGSIALLLCIIPAALFVVAGLILLAQGLSTAAHEDSDDSDNENEQNVRIDNPTPSAQLRELKKLLDDGIITQEDFDAKKKQLLQLEDRI